MCIDKVKYKIFGIIILFALLGVIGLGFAG